jgi:hypothetical protein
MARDSLKLYDLMLRPDPVRSEAVADPFNEFGAGAVSPWEGAPFDLIGQFGDFVDEIQPGPGFHFAHLLLPHAPYSYYPSGTQYNSGDELAGHESEIWTDPVLTDQGHQRHLLQAQAMDDLVGDLLNRLETVGMMDDTLLVVTADHGISFISGGPSRAITLETAYEIGLVPLFIKTPHQETGSVESRPARTIDVLPTVAEQLGVELPWDTDGHSLTEGRDSTLAVRAKAGGEVTLDDPEQGLGEALESAYSMFDTSGEFDLFAISGYGSLRGAATVLMDSQPSGLTGQLDEGWRFAHVAPELGFVPGFVHGTVTGDISAGDHIGIALNGSVQTVVPVYDVRQSRAKFSAILPEEGFVSGFNDLDLFAVSGPENNPVVETIDFAGSRRFQMHRGTEGQVVALSDSTGASWEIGETNIRGAVDEAFWDTSAFSRSDLKDLHVAGWAVNEGTKRPADQIVIFVNGVFAGTASVDGERPDMQSAYQTAQMRSSGFHGSVSQFLSVASLDVRAYAISDGVAEELPITDEALADIAAG